MKSYFKHPRPITYIYEYIKKYDFKGIENIDYHTGHNSFPSGHTFGAFALFTLLALSTKNKYLKIAYLFLAILVGLSRIYLAQHFIEDVVFGSFLGICLAIIFYYLFFILWKNKRWMDFRFNFSSNKD
ncbi:MAG TPA: phosphatase PAP2 family protein [Bacteroidetes bacterium]|nr:phosphatase PAP2 family protein [Bacteroidota bacterium]